MTKPYIIKNDVATYYYKDVHCTIIHREDGPAMEYHDGSKFWYLNGKRHREDGPAIEYWNGDKSWWLNGKRHRENGPAIECSNGIKYWCINNSYYSESEFYIKIGRKNLIMFI